MTVPFHAGSSPADCVRPFTALFVFVSLLMTARADEGVAKPAATDNKTPVSRVPDAAEKPVVTAHSITVEGRSISYHAEAGMLPLLKEDGAAKASVFYVAYTLDPPREPDATGTPGDAFDAAQRPLLFCFNGGPGASAVWLHLGGLGPRRAKMNDDGSLPAPPFQLVDNESTALLAADLVFIDPVATGYSRAAKDEKPEQFFGKGPDIDAIAEFIRLYTTRHKRWRSPKYLCGESYGVFRAAGLASTLQDEHGMFLSGLVLVSGLVDFETIRTAPCNDLPFSTFLPSFTAVAHAHKRLPPDLQQSLPQAIANRENGMQLFDQHLADLYKSGQISGTEALRLATNAEAVALSMRGMSTLDTASGLVR